MHACGQVTGTSDLSAIQFSGHLAVSANHRVFFGNRYLKFNVSTRCAGNSFTQDQNAPYRNIVLIDELTGRLSKPM